MLISLSLLSVIMCAQCFKTWYETGVKPTQAACFESAMFLNVNVKNGDCVAATSLHAVLCYKIVTSPGKGSWNVLGFARDSSCY